MRIFAISDLHLDTTNSKPMDVFGPVWQNQQQEIIDSAKRLNITDEDLILIPGDLSWAMRTDEAKRDLEFLTKFPGKKLVIKGNHDYWWSSLSKVKQILPENVFAIQNNAIKFENIIICGTRGWDIDEGRGLSKQDEVIFQREAVRLKLSITEAKKLQTNNEEIICMMHYPPFNFKKESTKFTSLIEEADIKIVVYGHIHNNFKGRDAITIKNGVYYYLTSCDFLNNNIIPIKV